MTSSLKLTSRIVGDVGVLYCSGRVVAGAESEQLQKMTRSMLQHTSDVVLNFSEISYVDSSGLGALVNLCSHGSAPNNQVVLCNLSDKVRDVLQVTKLHDVFEIYESEPAALFALYGEVARTRRPGAPTGSRILCVDNSCDLLSYLREILQATNYQVLTTVNLADALLLLKATKFNLVLIGPNFVRAGASPVEVLRAAARSTPTTAFLDNEDAAEMARDILAKVDKELSSSRSAGSNL